MMNKFYKCLAWWFLSPHPSFVCSEVVPNPSVIRQWLRGGEVDKLEAVVIQGLGHKLLGEYASDLKVRAFLKTVPSYLVSVPSVTS